MADPYALERAAAAAWPAVHAVERDGWLLRSTPGVGYRRNNSALPLEPGLTEPPAEVDIVAVAPAEERADLDAALARRGWSAEGFTDVLVATRPPVGDAAGVARVDPAAWPDAACGRC